MRAFHRRFDERADTVPGRRVFKARTDIAGRRGPGIPWWGMQGSHPLARRRPGRRDASEGARVQSRGHRVACPSPTRGDCKASCVVWGSPQRWYHKGDVRCVPRFLIGVLRRQAGRGPLDPRLPWHVGFELTELRRQGRGSSERDKPLPPSPLMLGRGGAHRGSATIAVFLSLCDLGATWCLGV